MGRSSRCGIDERAPCGGGFALADRAGRDGAGPRARGVINSLFRYEYALIHLEEEFLVELEAFHLFDPVRSALAAVDRDQVIDPDP